MIYSMLGYAAITVFGAWLFWALYVFTMGIYRAKMNKTLSGLNLYLAYPIVIFAVLVDGFTNLFIAPILFLDIPREWLVTARLQRYMAGPVSWRQSIAKYICESLLNIFDPDGKHC